ncbi:hypothetical protein FACS18949_00060 [Clostridia bacterium]|nr:hypothetical protein FACS18949_00060 [Clostridia bacterium]
MRFTDAEISRANSVSIVEYAKLRGFEPVRNGLHELKIHGFGGLTIDERKNQWYCVLANKGGGAIQFAMFTENLLWVDAMYRLLGTSAPVVTPEIKTKPAFVLPPKAANYRRLFAYLCNNRGCDAALVQTFVDEKLLYQDERGNCVFVGKDKDGAAQYAMLRGTASSFRGEVAGSDKSVGFRFCRGERERLFVFESPIDMLSWLTLAKLEGRKPLGHFLSLGGLNLPTLDRYLAEHPNILEIVLCVDNDAAGDTFAEQAANKYSISRLVPNGKDFNDDLKEVREDEADSSFNAQMCIFSTKSFGRPSSAAIAASELPYSK